MVKIAIDAGHGLTTPGRRTMKEFHPIVWKEWELNNRIVTKVENKMKDYVVEMIRVDDPTGKTDVGLQERVRKANRAKVDYYLSVHHNAGIYGGLGGGLVVIRALNAQKKSIELQKKLYDTLIAYGGIKGNRYNPTPRMNLAVLRNTTMPSVLVEFGFMDSATDVPIIVTEEFAEKMANGTVAFLVKEFNLKPKKKPTKPEKKPVVKPVPTPEPTKYTSIVNYLKDRKIDSSYKNREKLAKQYGILRYKGTAQQNLQLIGLMQSDKPTTAPTKKYVSIVKLLDDMDIDSSYSNRSKLAKKYGITNYRGTAEQNGLLIDLIQGTKQRIGTVKPRVGANVRTGKGTRFSKAMNALRQGTKVNILAEADGWYEIEYKGRTGYIRKDLIV